MDDRAICLFRNKNLVLIPLGQTVVYRENLLKFTREYKDILVCQYPLGQTLKNHFIHGIAQYSLGFVLLSLL